MVQQSFKKQFAPVHNNDQNKKDNKILKYSVHHVDVNAECRTEKCTSGNLHKRYMQMKTKTTVLSCS